jgi:hypothetical protein
MLAQEFLYSNLQALASSFPNVEIKYKYNDYAETHIVELTPQSEYDGNQALEDAWIKIVHDFWKEFPSEDISFLSSDSTLRITDPTFTLNQKIYEWVQPDFNGIFVNSSPWFDVFNKLLIGVEFNYSTIVGPENMQFLQKDMLTVSSLFPNLRFSFSNDLEIDSRLIAVKNLQIDIATLVGGESNYAMAA